MIGNLSKLERNLGFKLRENSFCLAIDTATKSGIAAVWILKNRVSIKTDIMKLPAISKDLEDKAEKYEAHLRAFVEIIDSQLWPSYIPADKNKRDLLVLENSFLKMNVVTFGFLRALQGILYAKLGKEFKEVKIIFPTTARKMVGFESQLPRGTKPKDKKKEIMKWIGNVVEETITDDNIADALLLAFAGLKELK